jgi:hypothetical protein
VKNLLLAFIEPHGAHMVSIKPNTGVLSVQTAMQCEKPASLVGGSVSDRRLPFEGKARGLFKYLMELFKYILGGCSHLEALEDLLVHVGHLQRGLQEHLDRGQHHRGVRVLQPVPRTGPETDSPRHVIHNRPISTYRHPEMPIGISTQNIGAARGKVSAPMGISGWRDMSKSVYSTCFS